MSRGRRWGPGACKAATLIGGERPLGKSLRASGFTMVGKIQNPSLGDGVDEGRYVRGGRGVNMHGGLQGSYAEANGIKMGKRGTRPEACPRSFIHDYGRRFQIQAEICWCRRGLSAGRRCKPACCRRARDVTMLVTKEIRILEEAQAWVRKQDRR